ncbi:hypothetical protein HC031_17990 [Planosporangium thailandense]|uniref:Fibronectin type-III domain-containing protein n=1 Tax=Planosporangium thailandense TaxID=765197 RepID=A0ABX0XZT9_9ACTN|nr:hypothetical protein [Planosporangium thailandense]NJC71596.1 hypothetical protein [Planosporangium thailandense]
MAAAVAAGIVVSTLPAASALAADTGVTVTGVVRHMVADPPAGTGAGTTATTTRTFVEVSGGRAIDLPPDKAEGLPAGARVAVRLRSGVTAGHASASSVEQVTQLAGAATLGATLVTGQHTLTVLPVYWTAPDSATVQTLKAVADATAAYWAEQSTGRLRVTTAVHNWTKVAAPPPADSAGDPDWVKWSRAAISAAKLTLPTAATQHIALYFPYRDSISWAGLGELRDSYIWINGSPDAATLAHEFGHNLGLWHARSENCTTNGVRVPLSTTWTDCTTNEYGDRADVMGSGYSDSSPGAVGYLNAALADALGWADVITASPTRAVTVNLRARSASQQPQALKIPTDTLPIYVEYRPKSGRDAQMPDWAGVQVRTLSNSWLFGPTSYLLDMRPDADYPFTAPPIRPLAVWRIPGTRLALQVTAVSTTTAQVTVTPVGSDVVGPSPAVVTAPTANATVSTTTMVSWRPSWDAGIGVAAYSVVVDNRVDGMVGRGQGSYRLTLQGNDRSRHTIRVDSTDYYGNTTRGTPVTVTLSDADGAPKITSLVDGSAVSSPTLTVSWQNDWTPNSVEVLLDGRVAVAISNPQITSTTLQAADGTHTIAVRASYCCWNAVLTSVPVRVTVDRVAPSSPNALALTPDDMLSWRAATDTGSGVATYVVRMDGVEVTRTLSTAVRLAIPNGRHSWTVIAIDRAGLASPTSAPLTVVRDSTPPSAPKVTAPANSALRTRAAASVTWSAAADPDTGISGYQIMINGKLVRSVPSTARSAVVTLPEGTARITVAAVNGAGRTTASDPVTVTVDTSPPTAPSGLALSGGSLTWRTATDAGSGVASYLVTRDGTTVTRTAGHSVRVTVPTGRHTWRVVAVDRAGRVSPPAQLTTFR